MQYEYKDEVIPVLNYVIKNYAMKAKGECRSSSIFLHLGTGRR
jgi:hypothetical protein